MTACTIDFWKTGRRVFAGALFLAACLTPRASFAQAAPQPVVRIRAIQPFASEAPSLTPARLLVTRTGDTSADLIVTYALGGSAANGVDYQALPGTITIPAGQSAAALFIQPKPDALPEGAETVVVRLAASADYALGSPFLAAARIADDDFPAARPIFLPPVAPRFFYPASSVSAQRRTRFYKFLARAAATLNVTLTGPAAGNVLRDLTADVQLDLLDSNGATLAHSDHPAQGAEFLRRIALGPGTYFLRVSYAGPGEIPDGNGGMTESTATAFQLALSAGPDWDIASGNGEAHHVGLLPIRADGRPAPVAGNLRTWVVTHGRASSPAAFVPLGRTMDFAESGGQVLLLDWRTAAAAHSAFDLTEGRWFAPVASRIAPMLAARGLTRSSLSLLGHSWGAYVSYEVAGAIGGGDAAARFIALDPAVTAGNYTVEDANFSAVSSYAWAFWSSPLGSGDVARTADDAFDVHIPSSDPIARHTGMVELFHSMLRSANPVANVFHLDRANPAGRIWARDPAWYDRRFSGRGDAPFLEKAGDGFEGDLYAMPDGGGGWNAALFDYSAR